MLSLGIAFIVGFGITGVVGALLLHWWPAVPDERLGGVAVSAAPSIVWDAQERTGWRRTLERLGRRLAPRDDAKQSRYRAQLLHAGYYDPRGVTLFIGAQVACAILAGYAYTLYGLAVQSALPNVLPTSLLLACAGFFVPRVWLRGRIRTRRRDIVHALPDVLDCLMVCVEAGMGFDAAVARVAEQPDARQSPLHQELLRVHLETRAGRSREEALRALSERTGVEEIRAMVGAFIQTTRLGTPLGKTLRVHSEIARVQRRHRAEQQAHLAPIKMLFPTVAFLMPSFFLVAMAPSVLSLMKALKSIGR